MKLVFKSENEKYSSVDLFISNNIHPEDIVKVINTQLKVINIQLPDECYKNEKRTCTQCWGNFFHWQEQLGNIVIEKDVE